MPDMTFERIGSALYALYLHVEQHGGRFAIERRGDNLITTPTGMAEVLERMVTTLKVAAPVEHVRLVALSDKEYAVDITDAEDRQGGQAGQEAVEGEARDAGERPQRS